MDPLKLDEIRKHDPDTMLQIFREFVGILSAAEELLQLAVVAAQEISPSVGADSVLSGEPASAPQRSVQNSPVGDLTQPQAAQPPTNPQEAETT
jgi:hypothetical protein